MSGLKHFLAKNGIKVKGEHFPTGHVVVAGVDTVLTAVEIAEVHGAVGAVAGVAGPIVAAAGVWMALGSGYAEAREIVENENTASGFSQGFVAALLGWSPKQTADHFMRHNVIRINAFDGQTDVIRVEAYNRGLRKGYLLGAGLPEGTRKAYLKEIKAMSNAVAPKHWSGDQNKRARIDYVIDLASSGLRKHFIQ